ncbi:MAG: GWxTD domain-containing protein [Bryobacterales bacterium]|nr:GWxTD domain-containing protein [Acidobacteriota bacterium]MCB9385531.1 GWxTD domain-containing protein [Bryobacterales bacterium]
MTALPARIGLSLATAAFAVGLFQAVPATAQEPLADSVYRHWLSQDVAYIIGDDERGAFLALQTDDERKRFAEQFWERRDPTPDTPENEAKAEHFRRIAYANSRFGSTFEGRAPGWMTQQGRIYIQFGPPDELEAHPSGGLSPSGFDNADPYEIWTYRPGARPSSGTVIFVDPGGAGNYRVLKQTMSR